MKFIVEQSSNGYHAMGLKRMPTKSELDALYELLAAQFQSLIVTRTTRYTTRFEFKDEADEAFFLVWSNDGIEI
jgi:hypothetical protein